MGEWDNIKPDYIPQCAVCNHVKGKGCKAFDVKMRDGKYYDKKNPNFSKCEKFDMNESESNAELFNELSKNYNWKLKSTDE
jgi:hypothetical protein